MRVYTISLIILYIPLNLVDNSEDKELFNKMQQILQSINGDKVISGKNFKIFQFL